MKLDWDDLQLLATLAAEKADDRALSMAERERWSDVAERVISDRGTKRDLIAVAELAELDAGMQRDSKVAGRYLALAARARAAA